MYSELTLFFFQAEDGIRDLYVTGVRRVLFRSRSAARFREFRLSTRLPPRPDAHPGCRDRQRLAWPWTWPGCRDRARTARAGSSRAAGICDARRRGTGRGFQPRGHRICRRYRSGQPARRGDRQLVGNPWLVRGRRDEVRARGWSTVTVNGRDHDALEAAFVAPREGRPRAVVAVVEPKNSAARRPAINVR